jgi:DNA-binding CsgD family transcriptional regulator
MSMGLVERETRQRAAEVRARLMGRAPVIVPVRLPAPVPAAHKAEHDPITWTPELVARLKVLWESGVKTVEIANELGCTPPAVRSKVRTQKFATRAPLRPWPEERKAAFAAMWAQDLTYDEMAERLGCSDRTIADQAQIMGLPAKKKGRPKLRGEAG